MRWAIWTWSEPHEQDSTIAAMMGCFRQNNFAFPISHVLRKIADGDRPIGIILDTWDDHRLKSVVWSAHSHHECKISGEYLDPDRTLLPHDPLLMNKWRTMLSEISQLDGGSSRGGMSRPRPRRTAPIFSLPLPLP